MAESIRIFGGGTRNRTEVHGFAGRCITTLPFRRGPVRRKILRNEKGEASASPRIWSGRRVSNSRPQPWQGCALPTELLPHFHRLFNQFYTALQAISQLDSHLFLTVDQRRSRIIESLFRAVKSRRKPGVLYKLSRTAVKPPQSCLLASKALNPAARSSQAGHVPQP